MGSEPERAQAGHRRKKGWKRPVDLRVIKSEVTRLLPPGNPVRELILQEPDSLPSEDSFVSKAETWVRLLRLRRDDFTFSSAQQDGERRVEARVLAERLGFLREQTAGGAES